MTLTQPTASPVGLTNSAFLRELAAAAPLGSSLWVAGFVGNPDMAGGGNWHGQSYNPALHAGRVDSWGTLNTYFSVAALVPADGELARRKTNFARLLALVADDAALDDLNGTPSWVLNTSPGKRQVGLLLDGADPDCADLDLTSRVVAAMAERGLLKADKSGNNVVRYVRQPHGQNQKPRPSGPFAHQLEAWNPAARYSLADAAAIFGIDLDELRAPSGAPAARTDGHQDQLVRTLTASILRGEHLHDSINMLAASLVASGMAGGAVVNMLRGLMESSAAPRDERWQARMADIPRAVSTAQAKYAPAVTIALIQRDAPADHDPPEIEEPNAPAVAVPAHLLTVPGELGTACAWINATARKPQPLFAVQAALAFGAAVMGRRYRTDNGNWPSVYLLNVGLSGAGKEHAKHAVERLLEAAGLAPLIGAGRFASESGVVSALIDKPSQFSVLDEFGKLLQAAAVGQNYADRNTLKCLMEVWGRADGVLRPTAYSTAGLSSKQAEELAKRCVRKPALSLLALTTPETLFDGITSAAVADGFLNRFLIAYSESARQLSRPVDDIEPPAALIDWARRTHAAAAGDGNLVSAPVPHDLEPSPIVIPLDAGALRVFAEMEAAVLQRMNELDTEGLAEMFTRSTEQSMRLALIVAGSCGHDRVLRHDAEWARDYVLCHAERNIAQLRDRLADGPFDRLCKDVSRLVRLSGQRGCTERDLNKNSRPWRESALRMRDDALAALDRRGAITFRVITTESGRGRRRAAWLSTDVAQAMDEANNADKCRQNATQVSAQ